MVNNKFGIYFDIIDFTDNETNYLYSDVINKTIDECETNVQKTKREILDAYVLTLCRFFQISSLILPEFIFKSYLDDEENHRELIVKLILKVIQSNGLNMLYSLGLLNWFEDPESDYKPEFANLAQKIKKNLQNQRKKYGYRTKDFYKELKVIGYVPIDDFMNLCSLDIFYDIINNKTKSDMLSSIFHFIPEYKEKISNTTFEFAETNDLQGICNLNNNVSKMYAEISTSFKNFYDRLKELRLEHFKIIEGIKIGYFDKQLMEGETREDAIDISNLNIFLFSSLYNLVDYLLYKICCFSNTAFDASKYIQTNYFLKEKNGKTDIMDYKNDKLDGVLTKEDFEKITGKTVDENNEDYEDEEDESE